MAPSIKIKVTCTVWHLRLRLRLLHGILHMKRIPWPWLTSNWILTAHLNLLYRVLPRYMIWLHVSAERCRPPTLDYTVAFRTCPLPPWIFSVQDRSKKKTTWLAFIPGLCFQVLYRVLVCFLKGKISHVGEVCNVYWSHAECSQSMNNYHLISNL